MRFLNQRRRVLSPEETAANAARKQARENASMACQCCGRRILAKRGLIAHHGYTRPGQGWQTASCMGAGYVPFAFGRDRLGDMIGFIEKHLKTLKGVLVATQNETVAIPFTFTDYSQPRVYGGSRQTKTVDVTRENFETIRAEHALSFRTVSAYDFDGLKDRQIHGLKQQIRSTTEQLAEAQGRYDGWKKTHEWNKATGDWVAA